MSKPDVSFAKTLHVRDACLCLHTQRAARALARRFDDVYRPLDLTSGQFSLLMSLNRPGAAPFASVARLMSMDRTTLTAALKPLVRRGLVDVAIDPGDRRARRLSLTTRGLDLLARALPLWERAHIELETVLENSDRMRRDLLALDTAASART